MASSPCFVCNGKLNTKRISKAKNQFATCKTDTSSTLFNGIHKLWKLSCSVEDAERYKDLLAFCKKCSKKLQTACKTLEQLENLQTSLMVLKVEIEEMVSSTLAASNSNPQVEEDVLQSLRQQMIQRSISELESKKEVIPVIVTSSESNSVTVNQEGPTLFLASGESWGESSPVDLFDSSEAVQNIEINNISNQNDVNEKEDSMNYESAEHDITSNRLKCLKCRYTFKDEIGREAHIRKFHEGNEYPFLCSTCEKKFKTRRQLRIHTMCHNNEYPFICEHCAKGFRTEKLLEYHLKNIHGGNKDFKCKNCEKAFTTKTKLKIHAVKHSTAYPVKCSVCEKGFKEKSSLKIHMVKHADENPWKCEECGKYFSCVSALKSHSAFHTRDFKFKCTLCPSGAPSQSALERHMISHGTMKMFQCEVCCKPFKFERSLQKHLQVHSGQKNYQCSLCGKAFIDKYKLVRHTKIHEGNKSFACELCTKRFYTKDYLSSHMKYHEKQAAKEKELLKKAKRDKRRKRRRQEAEESRNSQVVLPETITSSEIITSLTEVEIGNRNPILQVISSADLFAGVFDDFEYI